MEESLYDEVLLGAGNRFEDTASARHEHFGRSEEGTDMVGIAGNAQAAALVQTISEKTHYPLVEERTS